MREDRQVIWVAPSPGGAPSRGDPRLQLHVDLAFVTQSVKIKFKVAVDPLIQKVHRCKVVPDVRSDFAWSHLLAGA